MDLSFSRWAPCLSPGPFTLKSTSEPMNVKLGKTKEIDISSNKIWQLSGNEFGGVPLLIIMMH